jgi:hypothetical protein
VIHNYSTKLCKQSIFVVEVEVFDSILVSKVTFKNQSLTVVFAHQV